MDKITKLKIKENEQHIMNAIAIIDNCIQNDNYIDLEYALILAKESIESIMLYSQKYKLIKYNTY